MIDWIKERTVERTSLDGSVLIAAGIVIILFAPLAKYAAWAAIGYGVWTLWKSE